MKPKQTEFVPRLVRQLGERCGVYATLIKIETEHAERGTKLELNARRFFNQLEEAGKDPSNYNHALRHAKRKGYYDNISGKYIKIRGYRKVHKNWIWRYVKQGIKLLLAVDIKSGESLNERVNEDARLMPRKKGRHAGVALEIQGMDMWVANTHGPNSPKHGNGYYTIPKNQFNDFVLGAYFVTI